MKKIKDLNIAPLSNQEQEQTKGGFFFFLFKHFSYGYQAPKYHEPVKSYGYDKGGNKGGKKGY